MDYTSLDWKKIALLIIDMQMDFADRKGASYVEGTEQIIPLLSQTANRFRLNGRPVIHIVRLYKRDGSNVDLCRRDLISSGREIVLPHTNGAAILSPLLPSDAQNVDHQKLLDGQVVQISTYDYVIYKPRWGAFYQTPLHEFLQLKEIDTLFIAGCNFPNCPRTSIYQASERDYKIGINPAIISGVYERGLNELVNIGVKICNIDENH
ncbi:isochorismatase family cysteine hydrolase [Olivibacter sp. CPCC 100613]|uniref:cysteine hydrolase family protein n=1 Tax=Olivibacter sp. CPCC 100613 TaxID=3079931 RepID=UPI002FFAE6CC